MHCRSEHITPVFLPGDFHGQRSLVGYSPRGCNESDTTEWPSTHTRKVIGYLKCELALGGESQVWIYLLISLTNGPLIHQFSSVTQLSLTLYHPMDCSMPGFSVLHHFLEFSQTHVHWVSDAIQISSSVIPFSCLQSFPASGSFPMSQLFASSGQSIGSSASAFPMNIQGWFLLGLTGLISLHFKGLSRVFSNTTVWRHQFFVTQPSLWSSSYICTQLLEKP